MPAAINRTHCKWCNVEFTDENRLPQGWRNGKRKYAAHCKPCSNEYCKKTRANWSEEQRERDRENKRARRARMTPEEREAMYEKARRHNLTEEQKARRRASERKYKASLNEDQIARGKAIAAARRSDLRKSYKALAPELKQKVVDLYKECRAMGPDYEVDHIVPISLGGMHHPDNLQIVTRAYNRRKGNRWIG